MTDKATNNRLGIILMSLTALILALQDGVSRHLAETYNVYMVVMIRYWVFAAFVVVVALRHEGLVKTAKSAFPKWQWFRGIIVALETCVTVVAFTLLGLTETHAIFVCYPLLIAAMSGPILGESVGWRRWAAIVIGLIGVLIIIRPGSGVFSIYAILPLAGAFMFAGYGILTRYVASKDSTATSFFYTGMTGCVVMTAVGAFFWEPIATQDLPWLALLCAMSVFSHWLLIKTYDIAQASAVQPFAYLQLPFAAGVGLLAFGETIRTGVIIGASIVVLAGLFTLWRERES